MAKLHQLDSRVLEKDLTRLTKKKERPIGSSTCQKTPEKDRGISRMGCKASCRVRLINEVWQLSVFMEEHNHDLIKSPSKKRNLRSHKCMTAEDKQTIRNLSSQNMGTSQIHEYLAMQHGGKEFVRFKKKDISNQISADNQKLLGVDIDTTLMHFQQKKEKDPKFFYAVEANENGAVKNIFWADGRARRAYQEFGDVITFDTTYQTNKYGMPLAPFVGVNHHRHSIFFGMALVRYEVSKNFVWLFKTWLEAMYGKHPKAIITDQDPAMRKAIAKVFPNTIHRCCQWHVLRNARDHLGRLYDQLEGFCDKLGFVINRSLSILDFKKNWRDMVEEFKLHDNNYLKVMYNSRKQWVPAYFRDTFFANMSTTQRSESMNAMFKLWVNNHTSIYKFVLQIEKVIEGIWQKESDEDIRTMSETPHNWSPYQMEVEARQGYTRNVFSLFKEIVRQSLLGFVTEIKRDASYRVDITYHPSYRNWVPESYLVEVDKEKYTVCCNCKGFDVEGLLCSHAIKVMHHVNMPHLPDQYILKRWTRTANANVKRSCDDRCMDPGESAELQTLRFATIKTDLMEMGMMGSRNIEAFSYLREIVSNGIGKLQNLVGTTAMPSTVSHVEVVMENHSQKNAEPRVPLLLDPPESQCKGRRKKPTRFKPASEKYARKMRTCSICNAKEGHNARTCPKRKSNGQNGKEKNNDKSSEEEDSEEEEEIQLSE